MGGRIRKNVSRSSPHKSELRNAARARSFEIMKFLIAVIPHHKLEELKHELAKIEISRMTIINAQGYGRQKGHKAVYRASETMINFVHKLEVQIALNDEFVPTAVETISKVCYTGQPGDGKIFVMPLEEVHRISSKESGPEAI